MNTVLEVHHLKKRFGNIEAIRDVSFSVLEDEILGIIGPNGAGKTTLFNLIMGNHAQDDGNVILMGENIDKLKTYERVIRGVARTFQFARNFPTITVLEHIRMARLSLKSKRNIEGGQLSEVRHIAEVVRLSDFVDKLPGELNIEQLRKLELAMAMAVKPKILLIDEMFAGLTEDESGEITGIIEKMVDLSSLKTVVIIDHNLSALAEITKRVIAIDLGLKIAEGTFEEVCSNEDVKKAYLGEYVQ